MSVVGQELSVASTRFVSGCRRKRWNARAVWSLGTNKSSMRSVHTTRMPKYPIEGGVGDFLPPTALKTVIEWQEGLLQRLDDQLREKGLAKSTILQLILDAAGKQEHIRAFNYACLAANNSFFLDNLKPPSADLKENNLENGHENNHEKDMPADLNNIIVSELQGTNGLRERFVASASGMVSSGWLWLVTDGQRLAVVPTFGSGTLLVRSSEFWKQTEQTSLIGEPLDSSGVAPSIQDGPTPASPVSGVSAIPSRPNPHGPARSIHSSAIVGISYKSSSVRDSDTASVNSDAQRKSAHLIGSKLYPLFCLSLFEHTWMSAGLGVWGKEEYVRRFFNVLDWEKVGRTYSKFRTLGGKPV